MSEIGPHNRERPEILEALKIFPYVMILYGIRLLIAALPGDDHVNHHLLLRF